MIEASGIRPEVVEYLKDVPSAEELKGIILKLGISAEALIRKGESEYKELYKGKSLSEEQWVQAMINHPKLIERPIVIKGDRAVLGRPPENVERLL